MDARCDLLFIDAFSFLYRNERTATKSIAGTKPRGRTFQFPLSERTNCNVLGIAQVFGDVCAFSFLYRNERTATKRPLCAQGLYVAFSFLYRNERTAT